MTLIRRGALSLVAPVVLLAASSAAHAQDSKEADAERLFREGQKLLEERRFGEACPKFEQAYGKDRALGTLLNLAFCHKEQGALWYAWLEFREAEVKATEQGRLDRKDFARQKLTELEKSPALTKALIDNPRRVTLDEVLVDERHVPEAERGAVFAVETSGERKITFRAKGKKDEVVLVRIVKSDKAAKIAVPPMEDAPVEPPPPPPPKVVPKPPPPMVEDDPGATQRTLGVAGMGVGLLGLGVGAVTGLVTISGPCGGHKMCTDDQRSSARSTASISDVAFVAGGALVVIGGVAWLTAPHKRMVPEGTRGLVVTPRIGLGWAGVDGSF